MSDYAELLRRIAELEQQVAGHGPALQAAADATKSMQNAFNAMRAERDALKKKLDTVKVDASTDQAAVPGA